MALDPAALLDFSHAYPDRIAQLRHGLIHDELFSLPRLLILSGSIPKSQVTVLSGDTDAEAQPAAAPITSLVQQIETSPQRIDLSGLHTQPEYGEAIKRLCRPLRTLASAAKAPLSGREASLELTGPELTRPWRDVDAPTLLLQVRGHQTLEIDQHSTNENENLTSNAPPTEGSAPLSFALDDGDGIFLPKGTRRQHEGGDTFSAALIISWKTAQDLPGPSLWQQLAGLFRR